MSVNVHRRDLDASQRVLLASRLSALSGEVTLSQAGEMVPSPAAQPVAPDPGAQGGRRPAMRLASRPHSRAGTLCRQRTMSSSTAPVVRRPGGAVSVVASGLAGHYHIPHFRGADKPSLSDPAVLIQK